MQLHGLEGQPFVPQEGNHEDQAVISRRSLLKGGMSGAAAILLAACSVDRESTSPTAPESSHNYEAEKYPLHTNIEATVFGIGEKPSAANDYISNEDLAWESGTDKKTGEHIAVKLFGGVDDARLKYRKPNGLPKGFEPQQNPYYFALPVDEFTSTGLVPGAREASPWANEKISANESLFKGRWIEVLRVDKTIYAQWIDTGPHGRDEPVAKGYNYVFGANDARPTNDFGLKAGLDLSPTAAHDLGFSIIEGGARVDWRFVDAKDVPDGPWKDYPAIDNTTHWE